MKNTIYNKKDFIFCSRGKLFNESSPKLPSKNMLMMDRIIKLIKDGGKYKRGYIEAELDINPKLWFFKCHFLDDPVMPGCLGLDAMWQLVGFYLGWLGYIGKGRALGVKEVKFNGQILPTSNKVIYNINLKRIINRNLIMGVADGIALVNKKIIYKANDLKVGLFKNKNF